jgi:hypothetical protein
MIVPDARREVPYPFPSNDAHIFFLQSYGTFLSSFQHSSAGSSLNLQTFAHKSLITFVVLFAAVCRERKYVFQNALTIRGGGILEIIPPPHHIRTDLICSKSYVEIRIKTRELAQPKIHN